MGQRQCIQARENHSTVFVRLLVSVKEVFSHSDALLFQIHEVSLSLRVRQTQTELAE